MTDGSIEKWTRAAGDHLAAMIDTIVAEEIRRMRTEAAEFFSSDDPNFVQACTDSCRAHFGVLLNGLRNGRDIPATLPAAAVEETRAAAEWGIALDALVQTYRTGHAVIWEFAFDTVNDIVPETGQRAAVLKVISRYLFAYSDRMIALVSAIYDQERLALFQDRHKQRRQLIRDLLDGLPIDRSRLPYTLNVTHVAAIVRTQGADRQIAHMSATAGVASISVTGPSDVTWVWFGSNALARPDGVRALVDAVPAGLEIAFGQPGYDIEGFRMSHMEARHAHRIARKSNRAVVSYDDIALLSLTTVDEGAAVHFMHRELGYLASDEPRVKELRDTLSTYFDSGHNASTTAARMSLNDRTVAYRLRTIEQRLGHPILSRRAELAVALQLLDLYGPRADIGGDAVA